MTALNLPIVSEHPTVFEEFAIRYQTRVRQALVASYGVDSGNDAAAAAMAWAWEHQGQLNELSNPVAYLFRVGQSSLRKSWLYFQRTTTSFPAEAVAPDAYLRIDLADVLVKLPRKQRVSVLLVHAHQWTYLEVAQLLDVSVDAVTNYVHRGTKRLTELLKEES